MHPDSQQGIGGSAAVHDTAYERKTLILLGLGFGFVGIDRWIVAPLFPHMMRDLGLNFQQLGSHDRSLDRGAAVPAHDA